MASRSKLKIVGVWLLSDNGDCGQLYFNQPWRTSDHLKRWVTGFEGAPHTWSGSKYFKSIRYIWSNGVIR